MTALACLRYDRSLLPRKLGRAPRHTPAVCRNQRGILPDASFFCVNVIL